MTRRCRLSTSNDQSANVSKNAIARSANTAATNANACNVVGNRRTGIGIANDNDARCNRRYHDPAIGSRDA